MDISTFWECPKQGQHSLILCLQLVNSSWQSVTSHNSVCSLVTLGAAFFVEKFPKSAGYKCCRDFDRLPAGVDKLLAKHQTVSSLLGNLAVVQEAYDLRVSPVSLVASCMFRDMLA